MLRNDSRFQKAQTDADTMLAQAIKGLDMITAESLNQMKDVVWPEQK